MNTCAFLLFLIVQIYADGIEGPTGKPPTEPHLFPGASWEVSLTVRVKVQSVGTKIRASRGGWCFYNNFVPPPSFPHFLLHDAKSRPNLRLVPDFYLFIFYLNNKMQHRMVTLC